MRPSSSAVFTLQNAHSVPQHGHKYKRCSFHGLISSQSHFSTRSTLCSFVCTPGTALFALDGGGCGIRSHFHNLPLTRLHHHPFSSEIIATVTNDQPVLSPSTQNRRRRRRIFGPSSTFHLLGPNEAHLLSPLSVGFAEGRTVNSREANTSATE